MMDCDFSGRGRSGRRCVLVDAAFSEMSIEIDAPECPYSYSWKFTKADCPIYQEVADRYEPPDEEAPND